jgi:hypothetical protein
MSGDGGDRDNERFYEWLRRLSEDVGDIKVTLARNTESLEEHMRRSEILEADQRALRAEMKPLLVRDAALAQIAKWFAIACAAGGFGYSVIRIVEFFSNA